MNKKMKKILMRILVSAVLLILAVIFKDNTYLYYTLAGVSYVIVGYDIVYSSIFQIGKGQLFDENFLMSIATFGAFYIGELIEGVMVMLLFQLGELFQSYAVNRSRHSIKELMNIRPDYANLLEDGEEKVVDPDDVLVGSIILIKAGEKVPIDGIVKKGSSYVDTSALTGESVPRRLEEGDEILSGFVNQSGLLHVQTTREFEESTASKILELVENAGSRKAKTENFITKFAKYYTPVVVIFALALAFLPSLFNSDIPMQMWIKRACSLLVISCPCALVISVPLSFFGGIGGGARQGILIKGANYVESLANIETVVVDKTGTLTKGIFTVTNVKQFRDDVDILRLAALGELNSKHPIATSIVASYEKELDKASVVDVKEFAGKGVKANIDGKDVYLGNEKLMREIGISPCEVDGIGSIVYVAFKDELLGYIQVSDEIKKESFDFSSQLKKLGVKSVIMLTGDKKHVADKIGKQLKLDKVISELLPQDKVFKLEEIIDEKKDSKVAFVGDGINDAPVLARADIGISMGAIGSDAAIEASDVVIMDDDIKKIGQAMKIARKTMSIVWQNIFFALGVKGIFLILGIFGKTELFEAVFADVGVAFIAILNAMRALNIDES